MISPETLRTHRLPSLSEEESNKEVHRPKIRKILKKFVGIFHACFVVVVGPRGCGKSSAVRAACVNQKGVSRVLVSTLQDIDHLSTLILEGFGIHDTPIKETDLVMILKKAAKDQPDGWMPTIIVEVDRNVGPMVAHAAGKILKRLSCDEKCCAAFLVLSDAENEHDLASDRDRQEFIWIDDFTEDEANEFFDKRKYLMGETNTEKRNRYFRTIGTRPRNLENLVDAGEANFEKYLRENADFAAHQLDSFLIDPAGIKDGFEFEKLVKALLTKPLHTGIRVLTLRKSRVCISQDTAKFFKKYHAVLYHSPTGSYRFNSAAHFEAAKELFG